VSHGPDFRFRLRLPRPDPHGERSRDLPLDSRRDTRARAPLSVEDWRHPVDARRESGEWHLAHTTWFFETFVLVPHQPGYRAFAPELPGPFNSYYSVVIATRGRTGAAVGPGLEEVFAYRRHVDEARARLARRRPPSAEAGGLIELACITSNSTRSSSSRHVKHLLSRNPLKPAYQKQWPLTAIRALRAALDFAFDKVCAKSALRPRFLFRQRTRATASGWTAFSIASIPSPTAIHRLHRRRRYRRPELWLSAGWDA